MILRKGIIIYLLPCLFLSIKMTGQQVVVVYRVEEKASTDFTNDGRMLDFPEKIIMTTLRSTPKASYYTQDSLMFTREGVLSQGFRLFFPGLFEFRNKQSGFALTHKLFCGKFEFIQYSLEQSNDNKECSNWTLDMIHTKKILGMQCIKATRTCGEVENYAFITRSVPIVDGPIYYSELPGLILELDDGKYHYLASSITANEEEILRPDNVVIIAKDKYSPSQTRLVLSSKNVSANNWINLRSMYQVY